MAISEIFNQDRMNRCLKIQREIMENWVRTNRFDYTVRATQSVDGLTLDGLNNHYFTVGVGDKLQDVPFLDLLIIFELIRQQNLRKQEVDAKTKWLKSKGKPVPKRMTRQLAIKTQFSDEEVAGLLAGLRIETPFDKSKLLRVVAVRQEDPGATDDPQTPQ